LREYFTFQNFFGSQTLFKNVSLLPPATILTISPTDLKPNIERYWDYAFQGEDSGRSEASYLEEFDFLFKRAIGRQLAADVPVASYLSGGVDSGSIAAIASQSIKNMRTFTVGFDLSSASGIELAFDERAQAEHLSYLFKTEHYETVLKAGDLERVMPRLVWHLEEPRVGQSYPNFYAAQLASRFNKVVLSGTGGDELFGGYPWRYYRAAMSQNFGDYVERYYSFWQRLIPDSVENQIFSPIQSSLDGPHPRDIFRNVFSRHENSLKSPEDFVNHSLYFEAKTFLHGILLMEDKLSMAHGLESRLPFLDNDLVEFAMKLPLRFKLARLDELTRINENDPGRKTDNYFQRTRDGKMLLRKAMSAYVPDDVASRTKQGFSAPDASWFKGESIDFVKRVVWNDKAKLYNFLDKDVVQSLVAEHLNGSSNRRLLIWSLLYVEEWCESFL
jgi:asparagine synthase (glutamine-hydrolysing)